MKPYYIYIMANQKQGTLLIDITDDLVRALCENEQSMRPGLKKVNSDTNLVYFEKVENVFNAIKYKMEFEKLNKVWKLFLIEKFNPEWKDLFLELLFNQELIKKKLNNS